MKYWRGYLVAGLLAALTWALTQFAASHQTLVDMVYPYITRTVQTALADWTAGASFCLWQVLVILLVAFGLASIVLTIVFKWNVVQLAGWLLAAAMGLWTVHTGIYGLNQYAGPLADDIRLEVTDYNVTELAEATTYFRDQANALALEIPRDADGNPDYPSFEELAEAAPQGYHTLTYDYSYSVFAGSDAPVKRLGWSDMYLSMGITGVTMPITGEAAVVDSLPSIALPFTMCHELAHRMCIANERDANLAAFLACNVHESVCFRYSANFMALRYCYNALASINTSTAKTAAQAIYDGINEALAKDLADYNHFFSSVRVDSAADLATSINDAYIKVSGDEDGVASYSRVSDLLVSWYIQEIYMPENKDETGFDPTDKNQVDLSQTPQGA